jgi:hypothetical protein
MADVFEMYDRAVADGTIETSAFATQLMSEITKKTWNPRAVHPTLNQTISSLVRRHPALTRQRVQISLFAEPPLSDLPFSEALLKSSLHYMYLLNTVDHAAAGVISLEEFAKRIKALHKAPHAYFTGATNEAGDTIMHRIFRYPDLCAVVVRNVTRQGRDHRRNANGPPEPPGQRPTTTKNGRGSCAHPAIAKSSCPLAICPLCWQLELRVRQGMPLTVIDLLLDLGPDLTGLNKESKTPVEIALESRFSPTSTNGNTCKFPMVPGVSKSAYAVYITHEAAARCFEVSGTLYRNPLLWSLIVECSAVPPRFFVKCNEKGASFTLQRWLRSVMPSDLNMPVMDLIVSYVGTGSEQYENSKFPTLTNTLVQVASVLEDQNTRDPVSIIATVSMICSMVTAGDQRTTFAKLSSPTPTTATTNAEQLLMSTSSPPPEKQLPGNWVNNDPEDGTELAKAIEYAFYRKGSRLMATFVTLLNLASQGELNQRSLQVLVLAIDRVSTVANGAVRKLFTLHGIQTYLLEILNDWTLHLSTTATVDATLPQESKTVQHVVLQQSNRSSELKLVELQEKVAPPGDLKCRIVSEGASVVFRAVLHLCETYDVDPLAVLPHLLRLLDARYAQGREHGRSVHDPPNPFGQERRVWFTHWHAVGDVALHMIRAIAVYLRRSADVWTVSDVTQVLLRIQRAMRRLDVPLEIRAALVPIYLWAARTVNGLYDERRHYIGARELFIEFWRSQFIDSRIMRVICDVWQASSLYPTSILPEHERKVVAETATLKQYAISTLKPSIDSETQCALCRNMAALCASLSGGSLFAMEALITDPEILKTLFGCVSAARACRAVSAEMSSELVSCETDCLITMANLCGGTAAQVGLFIQLNGIAQLCDVLQDGAEPAVNKIEALLALERLLLLGTQTQFSQTWHLWNLPTLLERLTRSNVSDIRRAVRRLLRKLKARLRTYSRAV